VIARAELKATRGDIAGAQRLPEPVRAPAATWIDAAKARLAAPRHSTLPRSSRRVRSKRSLGRPTEAIRTMIRVVLFLGLVCLVALGIVWLADRPGEVAVTWLRWWIEASVPSISLHPQGRGSSAGRATHS